VSPYSELLKVSPKVQYDFVEGEIVLVDFSSGRYFSLDSIASRIWESFAKGGTVGSAVERILTEFDAERELVHRDVSELVQAWLRNGLLVPA